jgi:cell surface protein SprA
LKCTHCYIDDFEGSQSTIDLRAPQSWFLSSTPENNGGSTYNFNGLANDLSYGFKRGRLAWYTIDPVFYTQAPAGVDDDELSLNRSRRIYMTNSIRKLMFRKDKLRWLIP